MKGVENYQSVVLCKDDFTLDALDIGLWGDLLELIGKDRELDDDEDIQILVTSAKAN